jgi:hypothetical protein
MSRCVRKSAVRSSYPGAPHGLLGQLLGFGCFRCERRDSAASGLEFTRYLGGASTMGAGVPAELLLQERMQREDQAYLVVVVAGAERF